MFELKIKNEEKDSVSNYAPGALNLLKKITECLSELVEDAELKITESGITIQVLDNIHVCLINIFLSKNLFYSYRCDKVLTLGIKLKVFNKILKNIKLTKDDYFELNSSDEARLLTLKYENSGYLLSYDFKLYDFDMESYSFEEMSYSANVSFNFNDFLFCSKSVGAFDEYLLLDAQKESFNFKQISEAGNSNLTLKPNEESGIVVNVSDPIAREVNMRYINLMNKLQGLTDKVTIHIGENIPIFFEFSLEEYGYIRFYVAAKKED